ncbi:putative transcriptional regulator [Variovorax sp. PBS-H4]|uniref:helix-turn-helix transcriptional regulator n=1 Tax=Variovorax sp. PBS-H4 TaxID=434008 RepID=UPI00131865A8|nr:AlpA family phage regulatory protein [Variovorax sp. PBS-H4]VTU31769.1 putative transcriptional regulator [Variovorax sp. PBS-H4]
MKTPPAPIVTIRPLFLARPDAAAYLAISESLLDNLVARGKVPKPRKLSAGRTAWLVEDLDNWGRELPVSDLLPPENSGYGRAGKPA